MRLRSFTFVQDDEEGEDDDFVCGHSEAVKNGEESNSPFLRIGKIF